MSKDIKEYLKYYIGREVFAGTHRCELIGINENGAVVSHPTKGIFVILFANIKPILRKLSSITDEEIKEFIDWNKLVEMYKNVQFRKHDSGIKVCFDVDTGGEGVYPQDHWINFRQPTPGEFHWLLSRGFDLFDLIKTGLAIDKETLKG